MSLKKIREAVDLLRDVPGRSIIFANVADAAEAEIAALEKAAMGLSQRAPLAAKWNQDAWDDALEHMESIAKEAK